jgi:hypothetical protein
VPAIADDLSRALGTPVQPVAVPLDQVEPTFTSAGLSADVSRLYRLMYEGMQAGLLRFEGGGATFVRGTVPPGEALGTALGGTRTRTA